jgi:hypothetical protein
MRAVARREREAVHIEDILEVAGDRVDLAEVRSWLAMAAEGYEDPNILDSFDAVVQRIQSRSSSDPKPGAS